MSGAAQGFAEPSETSQSAYYRHRAEQLAAATESRELTPEPHNPPRTATDSEWAACPFDAKEAFDLSSIAGYLYKQAHKAGLKGDHESQREFNRLGASASGVSRKIRGRLAIGRERGQ